MFAQALSPCYICTRPFFYHPHKVPSLRDANNERQPICGHCITQANIIRASKGLPQHKIHPEAYEPCPEEEL